MCYRSDPVAYAAQPQIVWYRDDLSAELTVFRVCMVVAALFFTAAAAAAQEPGFLVLTFVAVVLAICPRLFFEIDWGAPAAYNPRPYRQQAAGHTTVVVHQAAPAPSASAHYYPAASTFGTSYSAPAYSAPPLTTHTVALVDESRRQRAVPRSAAPQFQPDPVHERTQKRDPHNPYDVRGYKPAPIRTEALKPDGIFLKRTEARSAVPQFTPDPTTARAQARPRN